MGHLICASPGCGRGLSPANRSGVCRAHNHSEWCGCAACDPRRDTPSPLPPPVAPVVFDAPPRLAEVRTVQIPVFTTCSNVPGYASVSLPREPWEVSP